MATYSAVVCLDTYYSAMLHLYDAVFPPDTLKLIELAYKELKSFGDFVERLDSRRMSASLQRVTLEILEYVDHVFVHQTSCDASTIVERTHSLTETLKKTKLEGKIYNKVSLSKMVGLGDVRTELKVALLLRPFMRPLNLIFLHGMAGIGKTTLAREVFQDLDISEWFQYRVWVTVGLQRKPQDFTQPILAQLNPTEMVVTGGDEEQRLNQLLKDKRCLLVFDDVWDHNHNFHDDDWYRFLGKLQGKSASRILITSRIFHKDYIKNAYYFKKARNFYLIQMRLLNIEESWDLLREKAFAGGSCPPQLEKAGKDIAEKCDGLPLTILTVAHLLSKDLQESLWIDVAAQRKHPLFVDAYDQISEVLYPSYKELIDELKLCFLYMGVFPLKSKIRRTKLINLWTVEEIIDPTVKPTELYHHESLKYLDLCSLLMVYEKSSTYFDEPPTQAIRTCGLHSSWWHFCQREARKTNFFYVLDSREDSLKEECIKIQNRLSIHHNVLYRLPNLKKLKIRIELTPGEADPLCFSDHISNMINLESFKCIVVNPECKFDQVVPPVASLPVLPSSLKKLSLSGMGYPWEEMREIALLPCLQQLKLRCNAFQGKNWQVEEEGFPSLYFLLIEDIDLVNLVGSFRSLKHLSIKHCYKLKEIQFIDFKDVSRIELVDSNPLVEKSIKTSIIEEGVLKGDLSVHYSWKPARENLFRRMLKACRSV